MSLTVSNDTFMIENNCNDAMLKCSMSNSQFSSINSVNSIKKNISAASESSIKWNKEL